MDKYFNVHDTGLRPIDRLAAFVLAAVLLALLALLAGGCGEPMNIYQVQGTCVATSQRVLVLPFMDTRTFTDPNDPHREDLGEHARNIYVLAMRENPVLRDTEILAPSLPRQEKSLTGAEVAEIGRRYGADVVVAGQVFSFTETRAASIPPRAGMFVRLVSAADGSILFVGDHYQSAPIPGASGGRDLQVRQVADRLIEGMVRQGRPLAARRGLVSSSVAYAAITAGDRGRGGEQDPIPLPPPLIELDAASLDPATWSEQPAPAIPAVAALGGDFYSLPASEPEPLPPPEPDFAPEEAEEEPSPEPEAVAETPLSETPEPEAHATAAVPEAEVEPAMVVREPEAPLPAEAATPASLTGDELAADLLASEGDVWIVAGTAVEPVPGVVVPEPAEGSTERILESYEAYVAADAPEVWAAETGEAVPALTQHEYITEAELELALGGAVDGPIYSTPLAVVQPRTFRSIDLVEMDDDPEALRVDAEARVAVPSRAVAEAGAIRVLVLPYHDRENENNLIPNTGGGEVVTTLYGAQLAQDPRVRVMWDASGQATHDRLVDRDEAVKLGRMVGADFVVRGQVVEFRRAQSVPSFYSAVISTAVLAAQIVFAEFSGVDVATEVYRVADGSCVMSRRDRARQKYVVQSEKTVRKLAAGMSKSVTQAVTAANPEEMDPLIDILEPSTAFSNNS